MRMTTSIRVHAPADRVYGLAVDLDRWPQTIRAIERVESLTPGPVAVGTRFKETRKMFGREATETMEFVELTPPTSYAVAADACGCRVVSRFRFTPVGDATEVTLEMDASARGFVGKLLAPLAWMMLAASSKCVQEDLADLKAAAEATPASSDE